MTRILTLLIAALALTACAGFPDEPQTANARRVAAIANGDHRSDENIARNQYRHPWQTLTFFGVEPDMTVVEVWPGSGWYTEILAPYLRDRGTFYAAGFSLRATTTPAYRERIQRQYKAKLDAEPSLYSAVNQTGMGPPQDWWIAPAGTADRVLTFRNVHNWIKGGYADLVFDAFYDALKPGGVLGVIEHRADPGTDVATMKKTGYVTVAHVKELAAGAGLNFIAASEINANPDDDHDHPEGVWTLPPTLRLGDKNRERYLAIGESDRMTLKFRKPGG